LAVHEAQVAPHEELDQVGGAEEGVAVGGCGDRGGEGRAVGVQGFVEEGVLGPVVERVAGVQVVEVRGGEGEHRVDEVRVLLRL
jgi:hypothetical protein